MAAFFKIFFVNIFSGTLLYIIAVVLVIGWLPGIFVYSSAGLIYILIVLAIIALLSGLTRRARNYKC